MSILLNRHRHQDPQYPACGQVLRVECNVNTIPPQPSPQKYIFYKKLEYIQIIYKYKTWQITFF